MKVCHGLLLWVATLSEVEEALRISEIRNVRVIYPFSITQWRFENKEYIHGQANCCYRVHLRVCVGCLGDSWRHNFFAHVRSECRLGKPCGLNLGHAAEPGATRRIVSAGQH